MSTSTNACYIAVAEALADEDRALIDRRLISANPWLQGASTVDILSVADADGYLRWTEPFGDEHPGYADMVGVIAGLDAVTAHTLGRVAVLACALITGAVPRANRVELLIRRACQRLVVGGVT